MKMQATYTKLNNGEWGIRVTGSRPKLGETVEVTKRSGEVKEEQVGIVLWSGDDVHLCTVQEPEQDEPDVPQPASQPVPQAAEAPRAPTDEQPKRASTQRLPFVLPDRELYRIVSDRGELSEHKLVDVHDRLTKLRRLQDPQDIHASLSKLHVDFDDQHMSASWSVATDTTTGGTIYLVSNTAASQLASNVLPSRFFPGLRQLAKMDWKGAKLAEGAWNHFASRTTKKRKVRTARAKVNGQIRHVIRSCHSTQYAPYDNLELVSDILDYAGDFSAMPVISCWVSDQGMRIRFYAIDPTVAAFMNLDPDSLLNEPIPMIEVWNSEVGRRRIGMRAGLYRVVSATGLTAWSDKQEFSWIHRGKSTRISDGFRSAFSSLLETAQDVIAVYKEAMTIDIDDAEAYLVAVLGKHGASDSTIKHAKTFLAEDATITPGGTLASVVDAIALAAQKTCDLFMEEEIEKIASLVMIQGRDAFNTGELLMLKAEEV
jgi:hypothetical protein